MSSFLAAAMIPTVREVRGVNLDPQTRCEHYRGPLDIVAIKMKCCGAYYACKDCHAALANHEIALWPEKEWGREAILCGACGVELTIHEYMRSDSRCPACRAPFNPGCRNHYHYYFEGRYVEDRQGDFDGSQFEIQVEKNHGKRLLVSKKANIINRKSIHIEWGDCDPAQIVHYPRYLAYFDACTTALFKKAGISKRQMLKTHQIIGIPMVALQASFLAPSRFSDTVIVESEITEWGRSSFHVRHRLFNRGVLGVECFETRVWAAISADDPEKIEGRPVPREIIEKFLVHGKKTVRKKLQQKK